MAIENNISIFRGEDITQPFRMTPVRNITGWTIVFSLKAAFADVTPLDMIACSITDPVLGLFEVFVPSEVTLRSPGCYVYDVQRTDSGSFGVLSIGKFVVKPEVRL